MESHGKELVSAGRALGDPPVGTSTGTRRKFRAETEIGAEATVSFGPCPGDDSSGGQTPVVRMTSAMIPHTGDPEISSPGPGVSISRTSR